MSVQEEVGSESGKNKEKLTNVRGVVGRAEDKLWCPVVPRADITDVWFPSNEDLRRAKVAKLQNARCWIQEKVLWLDVPVADTDAVDVGQTAEQLIHIKLDKKHRHRLLELRVVSRGAVYRLWHVLKHEIEEDFILLQKVIKMQDMSV